MIDERLANPSPAAYETQEEQQKMSRDLLEDPEVKRLTLKYAEAIVMRASALRGNRDSLNDGEIGAVSEFLIISGMVSGAGVLRTMLQGHQVSDMWLAFHDFMMICLMKYLSGEARTEKDHLRVKKMLDEHGERMTSQLAMKQKAGKRDN